MSTRDQVVRLARSSVGTGSEYSAKFPGIAWCGIWALDTLHKAGIGKNLSWKFGEGFLSRLPRTSTPHQGDLLYVDSPNQHHAIVTHFDGHNVFSIDGNQAGGVVAERARRYDPSNMFFFSIAPLLTNAHRAQTNRSPREVGPGAIIGAMLLPFAVLLLRAWKARGR